MIRLAGHSHFLYVPHYLVAAMRSLMLMGLLCCLLSFDCNRRFLSLFIALVCWLSFTYSSHTKSLALVRTGDSGFYGYDEMLSVADVFNFVVIASECDVDLLGYYCSFDISLLLNRCCLCCWLWYGPLCQLLCCWPSCCKGYCCCFQHFFCS